MDVLEPPASPSGASTRAGSEAFPRFAGRLGRRPEGSPMPDAGAGPAWQRWAPLALVVAVAAVLDTVSLAQNGYANNYYSAGVRSMLESWHNFFFVAFDPNGLESIDKPPLALWLQAASARVLGFHPLSLLLPEALAGVAAVAALYLIMRRRFGTAAAVAAGLTLAAFPSFVAVARDNNPDALLLLLMTLACGAGLRAIERGSLRWLLGAAVLVGLAFNTKALAAYLVVPGIAVAYLVCAPGSSIRRVAHLAAAGLLCAALSFAWMLTVDAVPPSHRPYVGSSTDNSELNLTFSYNGIGRVKGQFGGPTPITAVKLQPLSGRTVLPAPTPPGSVPPATPVPDVEPSTPQTVTTTPAAFGANPGPFRLFRAGMGDQDAWLLAFALFGGLAVLLARPGRRDPRLAALIVFGGFFTCEALFLSVSKGIVHPYYVSALGPGTAALVGMGLWAMLRLARLGRLRRSRQRRGALGLGLTAVAVAGTAAVQVGLLRHAGYLQWWAAVLAVAAVGWLASVVVVRRVARWSLVAMLGALLVAPTVYAATTWERPVQGTFPAAGPHAVGGQGGAGASAVQLQTYQQLDEYVLSHGATEPYELLTQSSLVAATPILLGLRASAFGGYGAIDPALDGPSLGRLVAAHEARYVMLGGSYAYRGGNAASRAAQLVCPAVPMGAWRVGSDSTGGLSLVDCAGEAAALERQP